MRGPWWTSMVIGKRGDVNWELGHDDGDTGMEEYDIFYVIKAQTVEFASQDRFDTSQ